MYERQLCWLTAVSVELLDAHASHDARCPSGTTTTTMQMNHVNSIVLLAVDRVTVPLYHTLMS